MPTAALSGYGAGLEGAPSTALRSFGKILLSAGAPVAPTGTSRRRASSTVLIPLRCQVMQVDTSRLMLPSQVNFCAS
jgi:hypothetical protein